MFGGGEQWSVIGLDVRSDPLIITRYPNTTAAHAWQTNIKVALLRKQSAAAPVGVKAVLFSAAASHETSRLNSGHPPLISCDVICLSANLWDNSSRRNDLYPKMFDIRESSKALLAAPQWQQICRNAEHFRILQNTAEHWPRSSALSAMQVMQKCSLALHTLQKADLGREGNVVIGKTLPN